MFNLSSGVNSFEDLYDVHEYGNFIGSQGDDLILGGASNGVGLSGGIGNDVLYGNELDFLRYDLEEELVTEEIIGSAIHQINNHVKMIPDTNDIRHSNKLTYSESN